MSTTTRARPAALTLTEAAEARIAELMSRAPSDAIGVKLSTPRRGCSGLAYSVDYVTQETAFDEKIVTTGGVFYVDAASVLYLMAAGWTGRKTISPPASRSKIPTPRAHAAARELHGLIPDADENLRPRCPRRSRAAGRAGRHDSTAEHGAGGSSSRRAEIDMVSEDLTSRPSVLGCATSSATAPADVAVTVAFPMPGPRSRRGPQQRQRLSGDVATGWTGVPLRCRWSGARLMRHCGPQCAAAAARRADRAGRGRDRRIVAALEHCLRRTVEACARFA